jgi:hypothetical protein
VVNGQAGAAIVMESWSLTSPGQWVLDHLQELGGIS